MILLYPFSSEDNTNIQKSRQSYISTFQQSSVLRTNEPLCVSF